MSHIEEYTRRCENAIEKAVLEHTKLTQEQFDIRGMSSTKNRILLNELVKDNDIYLEIGVYQGSTFVAALYQNNPQYVCAIDNFAQFDENGVNANRFASVVIKHLQQLKGRIGFINADCFNLNEQEKERVPKNVNVYLYDGAHEAIDQKLALTYYQEFLANEFIFIVDDWNYEPARVGTREAIAELGLTVHKEWELFSKFNGDTESWWNGFYVAVCEKAK